MAETPSSFIKLAQIQGRGRSLIASKPIKAGQVLLQDSPILLYPASLSPSFCSHCFRNLNTPSHLTCPNQALFCSPTCQSSALSHSPWLCKSLTQIPSLPPHLQTQALFLIAAYNLASISPPNFHLLLSIEGDPSPDPVETLALHSFISSLSPPQTTAGFSPDLTAVLLAKDKRNAFGLMEPYAGTAERSVRAYGIYPTASFFNHDCLPNACRFDYVDSVGNERNTDIIVRAIHDIEQGREICLSYFPVNWSYADRQQRLMEDYGFVCDCDRCGVERNWRDEEEEEGVMDEDEEDDRVEEIEGEGEGEGDGDVDGDGNFPHSYFFVRYMCERDNCGGTLAPLPPSDGMLSKILECNVCGQLRTEVEEEEEVPHGNGAEDGSNMLDE